MIRLDIYFPFVRILLLKNYLINRKIIKFLAKYKIIDQAFKKLPDVTKYTQIYIVDLPIHKVLLIRLVSGARIDLFCEDFNESKLIKKFFKAISINIHLNKNSYFNLPYDFKKNKTFVPEIIIISKNSSIFIESIIKKVIF